jgi:hypothetical protein
MPFGLGFFATAGAGGAGGTYELIETQILGSNVSSVTFSSLSAYASTYQHLQVRIVGVTSADSNVRFQLNADTGNNYAFHNLYGSGSGSATTGAITSTNGGYIGYSKLTTASGNQFGAVLDLLDAFETTKYKTARCFYGNRHTSTDPLVMLNSSLWQNTNALTEIKFYAESGNINATSRFSLYGLKAA